MKIVEEEEPVAQMILRAQGKVRCLAFGKYRRTLYPVFSAVNATSGRRMVGWWVSEHQWKVEDSHAKPNIPLLSFPRNWHQRTSHPELWSRKPSKRKKECPMLTMTTNYYHSWNKAFPSMILIWSPLSLTPSQLTTNTLPISVVQRSPSTSSTKPTGTWKQDHPTRRSQQRSNRWWAHSRTHSHSHSLGLRGANLSEKIADAAFGACDGKATEALVKQVKTILGETVFTLFNIGRLMDLIGGILNLSGYIWVDAVTRD
jgi:hypothetical protein